LRLIIRICEGHKGGRGVCGCSRLVSGVSLEDTPKAGGTADEGGGTEDPEEEAMGENTTDSRHSLPVVENRLYREFSACGPGEKWVSDITYRRSSNGRLYLTVIVDFYGIVKG
jgi:hypothetical protein